jgi:dihydrofolate synthase/folylpolyglutamate synthase
MTYQECLNYLRVLGQELRGVKFGLESITRILTALDSPHQRYPTAIVAGTNGKGSTCAILASILQQAGYRTGFYSSPHLVRVNERIRVNGAEISDTDFAEALTAVRQTVDRLVERGLLTRLPSFFEFLTATAFLHFARAKVEFAVLEVGMGGRLDATNVTDPRVAVITNIGLDHVEFLGSTHGAIAAEKAGVIRSGRPVVSNCDHPEAAEVIRRRCGELRAELLETRGFTQLSNLRGRDGLYAFDLCLNGDCLEGLEAPLRGRFQVDNAVTAVTAAWRLAREGFDISPRAIQEGLRRAVWLGRLEAVLDQPLVLLDGAHNPDAAREVAAFLREHLRSRRRRLVYASMRDKAIGEISEILFSLSDELYLTRPDVARAATPEEILAASRVRPPRVSIEPDPARAVENACRASSPEDVVLVLGSLFLVGAVKKALREGTLSLEKFARRSAMGSPA